MFRDAPIPKFWPIPILSCGPILILADTDTMISEGNFSESAYQGLLSLYCFYDLFRSIEGIFFL